MVVARNVWLLVVLVVSTEAEKYKTRSTERNEWWERHKDDEGGPPAPTTPGAGTGAVYAATGSDYLLMARASARRLRSSQFRIFTNELCTFPQCVHVSVNNSRVVKISAIMASPFEYSLFLDTDTAPCRDLDGLFELVGPMLRHYDAMLALGRHAMKYDADYRQAGRPPAFGTLNTGVIFYRKSTTHRLWRRWLDAYVGRGFKKFYNDQPDLMLVLWDEIFKRDLKLYVLGPHWNMKKWRDDYMTALKPSCCPPKSGILIDHGCQGLDDDHLSVTTVTH
mmetsp:Transcript_19999/g.64419  ORF Transcript_19999/g.64419 Transcript_19999/m.64419 type:complete len:279 (+) Transcript_19999:11-847(+)